MLKRTGDLFADDSVLPDVIVAPRTDPVYNAHGYLTKVPIDAITPYINAFTQPGDLVVDVFAGSGMTAVAARTVGRNAIVSDISVLGKHIGDGYLTSLDPVVLGAAALNVIKRARSAFGDLYLTNRSTDGVPCEFVRTIWSFVYRCAGCNAEIIYFDALATGQWKTPTKCHQCGHVFDKKKAKYVGDIPVRVVLNGSDGRQVEQLATAVDASKIRAAEGRPELQDIPSIRIDSHREMYKRSALGKWGLQETKQFFSARNGLALYSLWREIKQVRDKRVRQKLLFAFTAILPRASRRYQWSHQRPLNAATQNYYIAPVYFEWNVFELFERKVEAAIRSDLDVTARMSGSSPETTQQYLVASAAHLAHLPDESVDYVFTDPPFGSNLFYADMNLFHEAWLGVVTDDTDEAVIHTNGDKGRTGESRYEQLLSAAISEIHRVLRPGRHLSLVFGNSSGRVWSLVQRVLGESGFERRPVHIGILDKGQRSVKGLNSGTENVATLDLVVTVRKPMNHDSHEDLSDASTTMADLIQQAMGRIDLRALPTPSHVYLTILKRAFEKGLSVDALHLGDVLQALASKGIRANDKSGMLEVA